MLQLYFFVFLFCFISPKVNAQLVIFKPVTYIRQTFCEFLFYLLYVFMSIYHLGSEIDHILKPVRFFLYVLKIIKIPRMDTCRTPHRKLADVENLPWTFLWDFLLDRYNLNQLVTSFENSNAGTFCSSTLCCVVPNVFLRPIEIITLKEWESKPLEISSVK